MKPIQPEVYFDAKPIDIPGDPVSCILVAQIPTSSRRPHMFDERFYIRTEGGSARAMNVDEVRSQMLYTEARLQKVRLLQMELATFMEVCQMLNSPGTWSVRFDTSAFKVLLADICDMLQRDSGLLGLLHKIGTDAAALNQLVDRNEKVRHIDPRTVNNLVPALREEVTSLWRDTPERRAQLYNNCGKAQERLAAPFGPLPA